MRVQEFKDDPTGRSRAGKNHPAYDNSILETVSPEYSIGEMILGSIYRGLLLERPESTIDLKMIESLPEKLSSELLGDSELWRIILEQGQSGLASPVRGGQKSGGLLPQLMPLVPEIAYHACVLGAKGRSRWNPYNLLMHAIGGGLGNRGIQLIVSLGKALNIENEDDIFARLVSRAFEPTVTRPLFPVYSTISNLSPEYLRAFRGSITVIPSCSPAERFCKDLDSVLLLKNKLTRRQWTVLLEALLRVGMSTHILWVCRINVACWEQILSIVDGNDVPSESKIEIYLWQSHRDTNALLEFGHDAELLIKQLMVKYVYARFGINLLLCLLEEAGCSWPEIRPIGYSSADDTSASKNIRLFLEHIVSHKAELETASIAQGGASTSQWLQITCSELLDDKLTLVRSQSGFTNNILEFVRYSLGQVVTSDPEMRSYDQAYLLANVGRKEKPLWITRPGPAMLISLVHACCYGQGTIPASIEDFRAHLADYGLHVPTGELAKGQIGTDLESLGLVVDSPDAAGGRLLIDPF